MAVAAAAAAAATAAAAAAAAAGSSRQRDRTPKAMYLALKGVLLGAHPFKGSDHFGELNAGAITSCENQLAK